MTHNKQISEEELKDIVNDVDASGDFEIYDRIVIHERKKLAANTIEYSLMDEPGKFVIRFLSFILAEDVSILFFGDDHPYFDKLLEVFFSFLQIEANGNPFPQMSVPEDDKIKRRQINTEAFLNNIIIQNGPDTVRRIARMLLHTFLKMVFISKEPENFLKLPEKSRNHLNNFFIGFLFYDIPKPQNILVFQAGNNQPTERSQSGNNQPTERYQSQNQSQPRNNQSQNQSQPKNNQPAERYQPENNRYQPENNRYQPENNRYQPRNNQSQNQYERSQNQYERSQNQYERSQPRNNQHSERHSEQPNVDAYMSTYSSVSTYPIVQSMVDERMSRVSIDSNLVPMITQINEPIRPFNSLLNDNITSIFKIRYNAAGRPYREKSFDKINTLLYHRCITHTKAPQNLPILSPEQVNQLNGVYGFFDRKMTCYDSCYLNGQNVIGIDENQIISAFIQGLLTNMGGFTENVKTLLQNIEIAENLEIKLKKAIDEEKDLSDKRRKFYPDSSDPKFLLIFGNNSLFTQNNKSKNSQIIRKNKVDIINYQLLSSFFDNQNAVYSNAQAVGINFAFYERSNDGSFRLAPQTQISQKNATNLLQFFDPITEQSQYRVFNVKISNQNGVLINHFENSDQVIQIPGQLGLKSDTYIIEIYPVYKISEMGDEVLKTYKSVCADTGISFMGSINFNTVLMLYDDTEEYVLYSRPWEHAYRIGNSILGKHIDFFTKINDPNFRFIPFSVVGRFNLNLYSEDEETVYYNIEAFQETLYQALNDPNNDPVPALRMVGEQVLYFKRDTRNRIVHTENEKDSIKVIFVNIFDGVFLERDVILKLQNNVVNQDFDLDLSDVIVCDQNIKFFLENCCVKYVQNIDKNLDINTPYGDSIFLLSLFLSNYNIMYEDLFLDSSNNSDTFPASNQMQQRFRLNTFQTCETTKLLIDNVLFIDISAIKAKHGMFKLIGKTFVEDVFTGYTINGKVIHPGGDKFSESLTFAKETIETKLKMIDNLNKLSEIIKVINNNLLGDQLVFIQIGDVNVNSSDFIIPENPIYAFSNDSFGKGNAILDNLFSKIDIYSNYFESERNDLNFDIPLQFHTRVIQEDIARFALRFLSDFNDSSRVTIIDVMPHFIEISEHNLPDETCLALSKLDVALNLFIILNDDRFESKLNIFNTIFNEEVMGKPKGIRKFLHDALSQLGIKNENNTENPIMLVELIIDYLFEFANGKIEDNWLILAHKFLDLDFNQINQIRTRKRNIDKIIEDLLFKFSYVRYNRVTRNENYLFVPEQVTISNFNHSNYSNYERLLAEIDKTIVDFNRKTTLDKDSSITLSDLKIRLKLINVIPKDLNDAIMFIGNYLYIHDFRVIESQLPTYNYEKMSKVVDARDSIGKYQMSSNADSNLKKAFDAISIHEYDNFDGKLVHIDNYFNKHGLIEINDQRLKISKEIKNIQSEINKAEPEKDSVLLNLKTKLLSLLPYLNIFPEIYDNDRIAKNIIKDNIHKMKDASTKFLLKIELVRSIIDLDILMLIYENDDEFYINRFNVIRETMGFSATSEIVVINRFNILNLKAVQLFRDAFQSIRVQSTIQQIVETVKNGRLRNLMEAIGCDVDENFDVNYGLVQRSEENTGKLITYRIFESYCTLLEVIFNRVIDQLNRPIMDSRNNVKNLLPNLSVKDETTLKDPLFYRRINQYNLNGGTEFRDQPMHEHIRQKFEKTARQVNKLADAIVDSMTCIDCGPGMHGITRFVEYIIMFREMEMSPNNLANLRNIYDILARFGFSENIFSNIKFPSFSSVITGTFNGFNQYFEHLPKYLPKLKENLQEFAQLPDEIVNDLFRLILLCKNSAFDSIPKSDDVDESDEFEFFRVGLRDFIEKYSDHIQTLAERFEKYTDEYIAFKKDIGIIKGDRVILNDQLVLKLRGIFKLHTDGRIFDDIFAKMNAYLIASINYDMNSAKLNIVNNIKLYIENMANEFTRNFRHEWYLLRRKIDLL